jgi:hypothetical protein
VDALIDGLASAMADLSAGGASVPDRVAALVPEREGFLAAMPGFVSSARVLMSKLVSLFPHNAGTELIEISGRCLGSGLGSVPGSGWGQTFLRVQAVPLMGARGSGRDLYRRARAHTPAVVHTASAPMGAGSSAADLGARVGCRSFIATGRRSCSRGRPASTQGRSGELARAVRPFGRRSCKASTPLRGIDVDHPRESSARRIVGMGTDARTWLEPVCQLCG